MSTSAGSSKVGDQRSKATGVQMHAPLKSETLQRRRSNGGAANAARPPPCVAGIADAAGLPP
eukprot:13086307-Alexandrium_andersonii.AAC.1